jgi:hypothetical protein
MHRWDRKELDAGVLAPARRLHPRLRPRHHLDLPIVSIGVQFWLWRRFGANQIALRASSQRSSFGGTRSAQIWPGKDCDREAVVRGPDGVAHPLATG